LPDLADCIYEQALNSIQINPLDFDTTNDTRAFAGAKNLSPCGVSLPVPWFF
jgi:hypothetical protein